MAEIGDWVAFYQGGKIVISEVVYKKTKIGGHKYLQTRDGEVGEDWVLEIRTKDKG